MSQKPEHQQKLKKALKEKIFERSFCHWQGVFAEVDACVEPVLTIAEAACHPQLKGREMTIEMDRGDGLTQLQMKSPIRLF
jgi:crotonobetainyl-CoA:carnitine CoA-transferase CaiB-like acyl-CoA transferase